MKLQAPDASTKGAAETLEMVEAAREKEWTRPSFLADLFMGHLRINDLVPYGGQDPVDQAEGDAFLARLNDFLARNVDGDEIDRNYQIPPAVMKGLADLGCFGLKIPKQYGGLGLSQINYNRALGLVSAYDASIVTLLSAHQSIGVPQPLLYFGTEDQKRKYLPRFARGAISAFALTEPEVGSDPARMSTSATPTPEGDAYLLNGTKLWCTNGAIADVLVVMAQTPVVDDSGAVKKKITAFIVEKNMPGFEVVQRSHFMGLHGIQNAKLRLTNVRVPKENILWGVGRGLKLAFITLNAGRLSLPAAAVGGARHALRLAARWSLERQQWGGPIGEHEAIASKLARIAAHIEAMEAMTYLVSRWVDEHSHDVRLESAMAKVFCSERGCEIIDEVVQIHGGRGYESSSSLKARGESPLPIERMYRDARINKIVEGTGDILRLFIAREGLDRHMKLGLPVLNRKLGFGTRFKAALKAAAFYAFWLPRLYLSFTIWPMHNRFGNLAPYFRFICRRTRKLARTAFWLIIRNGPKLERRQLQLMRLVDIATDLFAMACLISKAHGNRRQQFEAASLLFCEEASQRVEQSFSEIRTNADALKRKVARDVLDLTRKESAIAQPSATPTRARPAA